MELDVEPFLSAALGAIESRWNPESIRMLAGLGVPGGVGGSAAWLVQGDARLLWSRWFLEGLVDPRRSAAAEFNFGRLFRDVTSAVDALARHLPRDERLSLARSLADLLWEEIARQKTAARAHADRELRMLLAELYPRCWICGAAFPDWARSRFLREHNDAVPEVLPFVDFYRPRLQIGDLRVEIEHVVALAGGGPDDPSNLRLACGWCNRAKGSRLVLYDAEGKPRAFQHPRLGHLSVPQPFWVIRLLALRGRCEWEGGCSAKATDRELTVAPVRLEGAPNPTNLRVTCPDHDPLADDRLLGIPTYLKGVPRST